MKQPTSWQQVSWIKGRHNVILWHYICQEFMYRKGHFFNKKTTINFSFAIHISICRFCKLRSDITPRNESLQVLLYQRSALLLTMVPVHSTGVFTYLVLRHHNNWNWRFFGLAHSCEETMANLAKWQFVLTVLLFQETVNFVPYYFFTSINFLAISYLRPVA